MSIDCRRRAFILGLILLLPATAMVADEPASRVLRVGPQHALKTPSAAARVAQDGDTVEIEGGDYVGDVASWRQNRLTLRGVNGRPHLMAGGKSAEGKAIWVIKGAAVVVDNIEFSGVRVPGFAGAGIRSKGGEAIIRDNDLLQGARGAEPHRDRLRPRGQG